MSPPKMLLSVYLAFYHGSTALLCDVHLSHSDTPHSVGLLWMSDQPVAKTSTCQYTTLKTDRHPRAPAGFEPTVLGSERP
jgi:hypothetical protein